ncbi:MAG: DUF4135 domain-containing protein [Anaerolineales bacterium]|nr:MAG: DUF4135 domain-containing protein [Anaerolineales bacterium]
MEKIREEAKNQLKSRWREIGLPNYTYDIFAESIETTYALTNRGNSEFLKKELFSLLTNSQNINKNNLWDTPQEIANQSINLLFNKMQSTNLKTIENDFISFLFIKLKNLLYPAIFEFCRNSFRQTTSLEEFFTEYPLLKLRATHILSCSIYNIHSAINSYISDRNQLKSIFSIKDTKIKRIQCLNSDPHNGHRIVFSFELYDGTKIVYKPRSLAAESYLNRVIAQVNNRKEYLPIPTLIDKGEYGWMSFIETPNKISIFHEEIAKQLGVLLGISTIVKLYDLHSENVVLSKLGIVVVDAEAIYLAHPKVINNKTFFIPPSVLDIGILPSAIGINRDNWWDISVAGITGNRKTMPTHITYKPNQFGEYIPEVGYHKISQDHAHISTSLSSLPLQVISQKIGEGFQESIGILMDSSTLIPTQQERYKFRYIHRSTSSYLRSLLRMTDASCGKSEEALIKETYYYIDELLNQFRQEKNIKTISIVAEEVSSLLHGDVPRLTSLHLDKCYPENQANEKWRFPSIKDSIDMINLSFKARYEFVELKEQQTTEQYQQDDIEVDAETNFIDRVAIEIQKNISVIEVYSSCKKVIGISPNPISNLPELQELDLSLYKGVAGIIFFLGTQHILGKKLSSDKFTQIIESISDEISTTEHNTIIQESSLTEGLLGVLYTSGYMYKLASLQHKSTTLWASFIDLILNLIDNKKIISTNNNDVLSGKAGWLLVLESIYKLEKRASIKKRIKKYTKELIISQQDTGAWESLGKQAMCGFSHGAAGIRYALGRVFNLGLGLEKDIIQAMNKALAFEQKNYDHIKKNWRDFRFDNEQLNINFSAWCHGAAGIGLAEIGISRLGLSFEPNRFLQEDNLFFENRKLSLCCGIGAYDEISRLTGIENKYNKLSAPHSNNLHEQSKTDELILLFRSELGSSFLQAIYKAEPELPSLLLLE